MEAVRFRVKNEGGCVFMVWYGHQLFYKNTFLTMEATLFYINDFLNNTRLVCSLKLVGRLFQSCAAQGINVFFALPVLKFLMSLRISHPLTHSVCLLSCVTACLVTYVLVNVHWFLFHLGLQEQ